MSDQEMSESVEAPLDTELASPRLQFYLRHKANIETWAALRERRPRSDRRTTRRDSRRTWRRSHPTTAMTWSSGTTPKARASATPAAAALLA